MQPYDCPNCGAYEGERHGPNCSLHGELVSLPYRPPSYRSVELWLKRNRYTLERLGGCIAVDSETGAAAPGRDMFEASQEHARRYPGSQKRLVFRDYTPRLPRESYSWPWNGRFQPA